MPSIRTYSHSLAKPLRGLMRRQNRPPVGAAPGTMQIHDTAMAPRMSAIHYGPDHFESFAVMDLVQLNRFRESSGVLWLNVDGLGDASLIQEIGHLFHLHQLALSDVVHIDQRAKVERYNDHLFIVLRMLHGGEHLKHEQLSLFVGKNFVLTFQEREGDCFGLVRERIKKEGGRIRKMQSDYLAYALIDAVVDSYFHPLEEFGDQLDALEESVIHQPSMPLVHQLHVLKRELLVARRAVWPLREAINNLLRPDEDSLISDEVKLYLRDCYDHTIQVMDIIETFRELAASQMELYVSSVSQRTNEVMKVLTMFASIFIPLTFIVGIYGMNFDPEYSPWNMPEIRWYFGYPAVLLLMTGVTSLILWSFWRRGWFHRS